MEIDLLKKFLGPPKRVNYDSTKAVFNCPRCKEENGYVFDDKYNLEVNLKNNKKRFKFKKICHCWSCGLSGPIQVVFQQYAPSHLNDEYLSYKLDNPYVSGFVPDAEIEIIKPIIELPKEFIPFSKINLENKYHKEAWDYVMGRGIPLETLIYYKIGFCTWGKYYKRIVMPSYNRGVVDYFLTRSYEKEPKQKHLNCEIDKTKIIFNEELINFNETVYLMEGLFDAFALAINIGLLLGKELTEEFHLFTKLVKYKPNIIIAIDDDAVKRAKEIQKLLTSFGLKVKILKIINKDLAKNFEIGGKKAIITILENKK